MLCVNCIVTDHSGRTKQRSKNRAKSPSREAGEENGIWNGAKSDTRRPAAATYGPPIELECALVCVCMHIILHDCVLVLFTVQNAYITVHSVGTEQPEAFAALQLGNPRRQSTESELRSSGNGFAKEAHRWEI